MIDMTKVEAEALDTRRTTQVPALARLAALGAAVPQVLLPKPGTSLPQWAVIACDQFTQDRDYWEKVRAFAGEAPSCIKLIYPEVYLEDGGRKELIASIHQNMGSYLASGSGVFAPPLETLVYVERDTPFHRGRRGLVIALDLEQYDWKAGTAALARPTEGTLPERLPARMDVRRNAPLETPHILVLLDDEENALLPALGERAKKTGAPLYDTELMFGSGRVRGWKLDKTEDLEVLAAGLEKLTRRSTENSASSLPFLYAVGDGNHSLAAAKGIWEEYKSTHPGETGLRNHPARWALVELESLYDPALSVEPIHRLVFGASAADIKNLFAELPGFRCRPLGQAAGDQPGTAGSREKLAELVQDEHGGLLRFGIVSGADCFLAEADPVPLAVDTLQPLLNRFMAEHSGITIDYIHGAEELFRLTGKPGDSANPGGTPLTGILLPPFRKQGLFETAARRGALPHKSFSMGEACEKRFYLECRKLFG
ncbi:hypothetical protein AGMMS50230_10490 [Spirochaetia bacterium]|nr:hypothetical protein AGMMS50230_10490 [Spirochaetia bacterium]